MNIEQVSRGVPSRCPQILDIRVDDPAVIEELGTRDTLEAQRAYGEELLELGARVARTQRPISEAHGVAEALEGFERRSEQRYNAVSDKLEDQLESTQESVATLEETVARVNDRTERALKALLQGVEAGVERAEGDSDKLAKLFKERLQATLKDLGIQVGRAEQVIASSLEREQALIEQNELRDQTSNRKGMEFEELVYQDLLSFGLGRGDLVERTGATPTPGTTNKKGDLFYQLQVGDRHVPIAIECKDEQLTMSGAKPFCLPELESAMRTRGGDYGIVVANLAQNLTDGRPKFPVLQPFGDDRFVVLVDREQESPVALEAVLCLIHRAETLRQAEEATAIDMGAVSQAVESIVRTSTEFKTLKATCTSLGDQVAKMRSQLDTMGGALQGQTKELKSLLGLAA